MNNEINIVLTPIWIACQLVLVMFKLANLITWSWWVVTMPTWIGIVTFIILIFVMSIVKNKITSKYWQMIGVVL